MAHNDSLNPGRATAWIRFHVNEVTLIGVKGNEDLALDATYATRGTTDSFSLTVRGTWRQATADFRYDDVGGVLYLEPQSAPAKELATALDSEEIFVVRNARTGEVVSITVPFVNDYWRGHLDQLATHLSRYAQVSRAELAAAISPTLTFG